METNVVQMFGRDFDLSIADNTPEGLKFSGRPMSAFGRFLGPSRSTPPSIASGRATLSAVPDGSVHLVVTSPPYWTLKEYDGGVGDKQLGAIARVGGGHMETLFEIWWCLVSLDTGRSLDTRFVCQDGA